MAWKRGTTSTGTGTGDVTTAELNAAVLGLQKDHGVRASLVAANAITPLSDGDTAQISGVRYVYDSVVASFVLESGANWFSIPVDVSAADTTYSFDPNGLDAKTYNVFRVDDANTGTNSMTIDVSAAANGWQFEHIGVIAGTDISTEEIGGQFDLYVDDAAKLVRVRRYGTTSAGGSSGSSSGTFPITGWSVTQNVTADRNFDADAATQQETLDVLGTLIEDLRAASVLTT